MKWYWKYVHLYVAIIVHLMKGTESQLQYVESDLTLQIYLITYLGQMPTN